MLGRDVRRAAEAAGPRALGFSHAELDITDPVAVHEAVGGARPEVVINCAAWTNVDGAEDDERAAARRSTATGAGHLAARGRRAGAWTVHVSSDYVFDGDASARRTSSRIRPARCRPTAARSSPASCAVRRGRAREPHDRALVVAVRRRRAVLSRARSCGSPPSATSSSVVDDQVGCPTFTGHLAPRAARARRAASRAGIVHVAGGGSVLVVRVRREIVARRGLRVRGDAVHDRARCPGPAPRPAYSVLGTERAGEAPRAAALAARAWRVSSAATGAAHEAAGLRRRRLHRLDVRAPAPARARRRGDGARQAHLRRPAREPARRRSTRSGSSTARSRIPPRWPMRSAGVRGDRQLRRRDARRPLDLRARRRSSSPTCRAPTCCSRRRASDGLRYLQVSTDEVYGSIEEGSFTEDSPLEPSSPYSATKAGADLLVSQLPPHLRPADSDLPRLQQLRALPVPREADPADDPQRARRRPPAGLRRRTQRPQLAVRRGLRPRHRPCARPRVPGRGLQLRRPRRVREPRRGRADRRADRCRCVADRVRHRPPRSRPALFALLREAASARLASRGTASRRASSGPCTGTARTTGGGSRSARAPTASTTSASTAAR